MRFLLVCMLMVIFGVSGSGQVRPDFFIEETSPNNSNFETYSQKNGLSRRASLANLRKYFGADVIYGSTPALTGNAENLRNKFHVVLPDSIVWFVDWNGDAARMGGGTGGGDVYSLAAVSDTTTVTPREGDLAVAPGVLLIRATSAWLQFQGGDDWGDQVVAKDSTLRGAGTAGDPLRVNRDSFLTAAIIEDSLAAVREDILPTDLSFTGASSPVSLESSTGTDVSFLAGAGIGLAQAGNQLTINNTGITGSGTANYIPKFTGTSTIGSTLFQEVSSYILRIGGSYNSNTTGLDIFASGANPYITQVNDNNNYLILRTNAGSLGLTRRSDNSVTMEINRGGNRTNLVTSLWVGSSSGTPAARLHTTGSGSTSSTFSFLAENSSGTDHFYVRDDGGVFVPVRSGTATNLAGWTSDHRATNASLGPGLSLTSGTLLADTVFLATQSDLAAIPSVHIGNSNLSLTSNRTLTATGSTFNIFKEDNDRNDYFIFSNIYERIGSDTLIFPFSTSLINNVRGKSFSVSRANGEKAKLIVGLETDYTYGAVIGGMVNRPTNFDPGYYSSFLYSFFGYNYWIGEWDNPANRVNFRIQQQDGLFFERRGTGTLLAEFKKNGSDGNFKFDVADGMTYNIIGEGKTVIGPNIETNPLQTNFPTALAGWSTATVDGSKILCNIDPGLGMRFSNDTLILSTAHFIGVSDKIVTNTTTETDITPASAYGSAQVGFFKAGESYKVEAWGYYSTDTINNSLEIRLKNNTTQLCTTGSRALTVSEGGEFKIECILTIRELGSGTNGRIFSQGMVTYMHSTTGADIVRMLRSSTNNVDTSLGSNTLNLTAQWATAHPSNSLTVTNFVITPLKY